MDNEWKDLKIFKQKGYPKKIKTMKIWIITRNGIREGQSNSWHRAMANIMKANYLTNVEIAVISSSYYVVIEMKSEFPEPLKWEIRLEVL